MCDRRLGYAHICLVPDLRKTEWPFERHGKEVPFYEFLVAAQLAPANERLANQLTELSRSVWNVSV